MKAFYRYLTVLFACATIVVSSLLLPHSVRAADEPADQPGSTILQWQASSESAKEFLVATKELNLAIEEGDAASLARMAEGLGLPSSVEVISADKITGDELTELMAQRRISLSNIGSNLTLSLSDQQISGRDLAGWAATAGILHASSGTGGSHNRIILIVTTDCCIWIFIIQ